MKILITGGTGYIGSHTTLEVVIAGHEVIVVDDFSNSSPKVIEIIKSLTDNPISFEDACQKEIPYRIVRRRDGDISECYAAPTKAKKELGWDAKLDLAEMCKDTWNCQSKNPDGY